MNYRPLQSVCVLHVVNFDLTLFSLLWEKAIVEVYFFIKGSSFQALPIDWPSLTLVEDLLSVKSNLKKKIDPTVNLGKVIALKRN